MARSHGLKTKTLRRMLKKKGMKTTGKKATLMKRLHMRGKGRTATQADVDAGDAQTVGEVIADKPPALASSDGAAASNAPMAGRRRRRSRRREEGGRRRGRKSRRGEMLGY